MQAIQTIDKPTDEGPRILARCAAGKLLVIPGEGRLEYEHTMAALALVRRLGWDGPEYGRIHSGCLPDGSYAHVLEEVAK